MKVKLERVYEDRLFMQINREIRTELNKIWILRLLLSVLTGAANEIDSHVGRDNSGGRYTPSSPGRGRLQCPCFGPSQWRKMRIHLKIIVPQRANLKIVVIWYYALIYCERYVYRWELIMMQWPMPWAFHNCYDWWLSSNGALITHTCKFHFSWLLFLFRKTTLKDIWHCPHRIDTQTWYVKLYSYYINRHSMSDKSFRGKLK